MLTYESLLEEAKLRGMPGNKLRGILREYLQVIILKIIYRTNSGKNLAFTGGTCLRLAYGLKRFSEDLDFESNNITTKEFENLIQKISHELNRIGIKSNVGIKSWANVCSSKISFPDIELLYKVKSKFMTKKGLVIKVEVCKPKYQIKKDTEVITGFGEFFPCIILDRGIMLANKTDAFLNKDKGRHIYDLVFMLSNEFPLNKNVLTKVSGSSDFKGLILNRLKKLNKPALKKMSENLQPFLFEEFESHLINDVKTIVPKLLLRY